MSQFIEMFGNPLSSVQRYQLKKLGDCCELNPRRPNLTLKDTDKVSFVPMPSVSENGCFQDVTDEEYGKVKKGFTYFENGDVLFAKITPCMENGKGAIAEGLTNNIGMGSTEFHVLRPIEEISSPYWLLALTRLPIFRVRASKNMTGTGGQKRVPTNYLENFMVGLPPIEEQNRYENIYKQADKSGFDELKSQFIEMFGDPLKNPKNYTQRKLGDVATLLNGRAYKASELLSSGRYLVLRVGNFFTNTDYYYSDLELEPDKYCDTGDILYSWSATLGAQIWKGGKVIYHYHIWKVLFDENILNKEYFCFMLNVMTDSLKQETHGSTMVHLTKDGMEKKFIAIPPLELQRRFVSIAEQADKSGSVLQYMIAC